LIIICVASGSHAHIFEWPFEGNISPPPQHKTCKSINKVYTFFLDIKHKF
jgi:hypothetical protein